MTSGGFLAVGGVGPTGFGADGIDIEGGGVTTGTGGFETAIGEGTGGYLL